MCRLDPLQKPKDSLSVEIPLACVMPALSCFLQRLGLSVASSAITTQAESHESVRLVSLLQMQGIGYSVF